MGYRRDKQTALSWKRWRQANEDLILATRLPLIATEGESQWWDYLMHEGNVPEYNYRESEPLDVRQAALKKLVLSWPGGEDTLLGRAFIFLEQRNNTQAQD